MPVGRSGIGLRGLHGHQFLRADRVDGDRVVEVRLGGAHLHRHCKALQHFVHVVADEMDPDHALLLSGAHQLHGRDDAARRQCMAHGRELGLVDGHLMSRRRPRCAWHRRSGQTARPPLPPPMVIKSKCLVHCLLTFKILGRGGCPALGPGHPAVDPTDQAADRTSPRRRASSSSDPPM